MDIGEFHQSWVNDIRVESSNNMSSPHFEFINDAISRLVDSEELDEDAQNNIDHFEGIGHRNAKIVVDSYCYDPIDNSYTIIINNFSDQSEITTITNSDIDALYRNMSRLVEASVDGYITDPNNRYEKSTSGYRLAEDIGMRFDKKEISKFRFYIITDHILSNRVKVIKKDPIAKIPVDLSVWDLNRFYNIYVSLRGKEDLDIDTTNEQGGGIKCIKAASCDEYTSYLATVSGTFLADVYLQYGSRLLEGNVRSFLSIRGKINKGIRLTILNDPDMFFTYNNGIAITATDVKTRKDEDGTLRIVRIKDMQIINGGQTTASVANALIQDDASNKLARLFIPAKITVLANPELAEEVVPKISRFANSQNKVDEADFFSNHPYHIKLEEFSRTVPAPAVDGNQYQTYWFYERARGQYGQEQMKLTRAQRKNFQTRNPKNQLLKKVDIAKYLNTFDCKPNLVSRGAQTNMRFFAEEITKKASRDDGMPWLNRRYYTVLIAKAITFKTTEKIVSNQSWYQEVKAYRANTVTYALAMISEKIQRAYPKLTIDWQYIWNTQAIYPQFEKQIIRTTKEAYDFITRDDRPTQNVTEWCKKDECAKKAFALDIELNDDFIDTLVPKEDEEQDTEQAIRDQIETNRLSDTVTVSKQPSEYWRRLLDYCLEEKLIIPFSVENGCLEAAANYELTGKFPSDKQCAIIMRVYRRLEKESSLRPDLKIL